MCKICPSCNGLMKYNAYFKAEICEKCGNMEKQDTDAMIEDIRVAYHERIKGIYSSISSHGESRVRA